MAQLIEWVWNGVGSISNKWIFVALLAIFLAFIVFGFRPNVRFYKPARTFDGRAEGFWPSQAKGILSEFNEAQLQRYLNQARILDMAFLVVYSILGAVAIRLAAPGLTGLRWLILLPFATAIADLIENLSVIVLIGKFRRNADFGAVPYVLVAAQRLKFLLMGAVLVVIAVLSVGWARRKFM